MSAIAKVALNRFRDYNDRVRGKGTPVRLILLLPLLLAASGCHIGMVLGLIPPETPKGIAASAASRTGVSLSWIRSSGATGYQVFRDVNPAGAFSTLAYGGTDTSFTDSGLSAGTLYWYKVRASSAAGSSEPTPAVSAMIPTGD
jgi:hypothetical protein